MGERPRREVQRILLVNDQAPGDVVVMTAILRELHQTYPNKFLTDVVTPYPELWMGNPYIQRFNHSDADIKVVRCEYPLIFKANSQPVHFLTAMVEHVAQELAITLNVSAFKGDIYLQEEEYLWPSRFLEPYIRPEEEYWLICAGGKIDLTTKWWASERYQSIVDKLAGKVRFVQVGAKDDCHPLLKGVSDLRGKTTLRDLIHLVAHSRGVVCGITMLMHLAAAVPMPSRSARLRPCVVIAGGREPAHWAAYPGHQFVHTVGMLPCCRNGGCWKARVEPLDDKHENNSPYNLCLDVVDHLPRCMHMITPEHVVQRIEDYIRFDDVWARWKL